MKRHPRQRAEKNARKWQKRILVSGCRLRGRQPVLAMDRVDWLRTSTDAWVLSGRRNVVMVWWAAVCFDCSSLTLVSREEPHYALSGSAYCVLAYSGALLHRCLPSNLSSTTQGGYCEAAWSFSRVVHSGMTCSVWPDIQTALARSVNCSGVCWKRGDEVEGYWGLRKWVQWSPSVGSAECGWLRWTREKCGAFVVKLGFSRSRCRAVVPGVLVRVHMYALYVCVYVCVYMYVYRHVHMYVYECVCVYVYVCMYIHVYMCVHAYLCIDGESQQRCFDVLGGVVDTMCFRLHMFAFYVCLYIYAHFFAASVACALIKVSWATVHMLVCMLQRCSWTPTYTSANTLAAGCAHVRICI